MAAKMSVSYHAAKRLYFKSVGFWLGKGRLAEEIAASEFVEADGKPAAVDESLRAAVANEASKEGVQQKFFYLGRDENEAIQRALRIKALWRRAKSEGCRVWEAAPKLYAEAERITKATGLADDVSANAVSGDSSPPRSSEQSLRRRPATVFEAETQYVEQLEQFARAGQVTDAHFKTERARLKKALAVSIGDDKGCLETLPLSSLNESTLTAAVLAVAARPLCQRPNCEPARMSRVYAASAVKSLRAFCNWLDEHGYWRAPPVNVYNRIFKRVRVLSTPEEAHRDGTGGHEAPHFTIDQLSLLYAAARPRLRAWTLLSLNCGFCGELADLKPWEIKQNSSGAYIERIRGKVARFGNGTGYAKWPLWPESVAALQGFGQSSGDYAFLTRNGQPLKKGNKNAIVLAWSHIWPRMPKDFPRLAYSTLRNTGAWMVKQIAGLEVSEMYLAHTEGGSTGAGRMNRHYAGRDWEKLAAAVHEMRKRLLEAGFFNVTANKAKLKELTRAANLEAEAKA